MPTGKCAAQRRRIVGRQRRSSNMEGRRSEY